ncbi:hypothetical protein C9J03_23245 [Photobacterium gaetbulicola]|nr:hypothetical protein C9J03_23245 [Photobacterium gaetbulicola]
MYQMENSIVILGAGKAGYLHFNSYYKLYKSNVLNISKVIIIDPKGEPGIDLHNLFTKENISPKIYKSLELVEKDIERLDRSNTIIDLCLPSGVLSDEFLNWYDYGFRRFILEKPFVNLNNDDQLVSDRINNAKVIMMKNYLHSKVHHTVKDIINKFSLDPLVSVTNFSKDRRFDSSSGRAFSNSRTPSVFEIEIPHQIYLSEDLFGDTDNFLLVKSEDMLVGHEKIPNHGVGVVVGKHECGSISINYSNLQYHRVTRSLDIIFKDQFYLHAIYAPICDELSDVKAGVILSKASNVLEKHLFVGGDDNMLEMLKFAYLSQVHDDIYAFSTGADVIYSSDKMKEVIQKGCDVYQPDRVDNISDLDLLQRWVIDSFRNDFEPSSNSFISFIEDIKVEHFSNLLPAMALTNGELDTFSNVKFKRREIA